MGSKKRLRRDDTRRGRDDGQDDSSSADSSDEASAEESTRRRSSDALITAAARRKTRGKEDILINIFIELKKIRKKVKKLTESHRELYKQLEPNINGSSGDDSATPRSELNQGNEIKYRLKIDCQVNERIDKGQIIETNLGKTIRVILCDDQGEIVRTGPLSSAKVMLVVLYGDFNQHGIHDSWSQKDFERKIKRSQQGNSGTEDVHQPVQSIVSNCVFKLAGGQQNHSDATILYNSQNHKVKLGVMVLSPTEQRVLEGLSNPFKVRDPIKPGRKKKAPAGNDPNDPRSCSSGPDPSPGVMPASEPSASTSMLQAPFPHLMMCRTSINQPPCYPPCLHPSATPLQHSRTIVVPSTVPSAQGHFSHPTTSSAIIDQAGGEESSPGYFWEGALMAAENTEGEQSLVPNELSQMLEGVNANGRHFVNQITRPVLIVRDWPLDHFMPLYSRQLKSNNYGLPANRLMKEHSNLLAIIPKDVMQTRRRTSVLIKPLEPDDSDEELPLKRRIHGRYQLRFVNNACEAYYTGEQLKADDGNLLKVALFDENNTKITSAPLSSASVEVVVLHGDFNVDGQGYWTSEEWSRNIVRPGIENVATVLGGDAILVLANGEACLGNSFFQITSMRSRIGKFKLGVMMTQDERIQEGISEPFLVTNRLPKDTDLPPGFRFHPTDEELMVHYLCHHAAAAAPIMTEVDIYKFNPWDLPSKKTVFGEEDESYFLCPWNPEDDCSNHAAGSGYWKDTGTTLPIFTSDHKILGFKKALVFYMGHAPNGVQTSWQMHQYRLAKTHTPTINDSTKAPSSTSSIKLDEWMLCKFYEQSKQRLSPPMGGEDQLGQPMQTSSSSCTVLPPGFRFHPTDEELILHYLRNRDASLPCPVPIIADVDIYKFDPWDLPCKAVYGDGEWYFFSPRDRKYPNDIRPNRAAGSGYWKATGTDKPIHDGATGESVGVKKALVFYKGRPPKATETNWIMHEYRLVAAGGASSYKAPPVRFTNVSMRAQPGDWVLCRIYKKTLDDISRNSDLLHDTAERELIYTAKREGIGGNFDQPLAKRARLNGSGWDLLKQLAPQPGRAHELKQLAPQPGRAHELVKFVEN